MHHKQHVHNIAVQGLSHPIFFIVQVVRNVHHNLCYRKIKTFLVSRGFCCKDILRSSPSLYISSGQFAQPPLQGKPAVVPVGTCSCDLCMDWEWEALINWHEIKERNMVACGLLMVCVFKFDATPPSFFELVLNIASSCIAAGVAQSNVNKVVESFIHNRTKAHPLHFQFLRSCHSPETGLPFSHLLKTLPKPSFLFNRRFASVLQSFVWCLFMDPKARKLWFWKGATLQTFTLEHKIGIKIIQSRHFESLGSLSKDQAQGQWQHFHGWPDWGS